MFVCACVCVCVDECRVLVQQLSQASSQQLTQLLLGEGNPFRHVRGEQCVCQCVCVCVCVCLCACIVACMDPYAEQHCLLSAPCHCNFMHGHT